MQNKQESEFVSVQGRRLTKGREGGGLSGKPTSGGSVTPAPFLPLIRALEALLLPLTLRKAFREELYRSLMESARHQYAQNAIVRSQARGVAWQQLSQWLSPQQSGSNRRWIWGAAAVGSAASVAGIVAIALRYRQNRTISAS